MLLDKGFKNVCNHMVTNPDKNYIFPLKILNKYYECLEFKALICFSTRSHLELINFFIDRENYSDKLFLYEE